MRHFSWGLCGVVPLALAGAASVAAGQEVRGAVVDSLAEQPLAGVRVELERAGTRRVVVTGVDGTFVFWRVAPGVYRLRLTRVGYAPAMREAIRPDAPGRLWIRLAALGAPLDPVVVSASRSEETVLQAPAAVSVIDRRELEDAPTLTPLEHVAQVPGIDAARKGLLQQTFSVRGPNSVNSGELLLLHDHRYAAVPSIAFNVPYLVPVVGEDVQRIEVIRGPAAALYGPGAPRGVVHLLTRSPLDARGGSATLTGGTRATFGASLRYAVPLAHQLGIKVSGEVLRGDDWSFADSAEQAFRAAALAAGADPDTLRIGRRDSTVARAAGDVRLDWRPSPQTEVVVAGGVAQAIRAVDLTPAVGAVQGRDWRYAYGQVRARRGRLSINTLYDWSDAGGTYILRNGNGLVDDSRVFVAQVQHGAALGPVDLLYGVDGRWTDPRTGGTIHGRNEDDDLVTELGGYLYATAAVSPRLELIGALRVDHHDRLRDVVLSPRVGLVTRLGATHAVRLTYNRAFTSPDANDLFLDIAVGQIPIVPGIGYTVRGVGVPKDGFTFRRDCDSRLCMRSPFNLAQPGAYLPADATLLWPAVVLAAQQLGVDLSGVPTPTAQDIATRLAVLDIATGSFTPVDAADVTDLAGEGRTITNVVELGYRGVLAGRLGLDVDLWVNRVSDLGGPLTVATPSAFFDRETLEGYLAQYVPAAEAAVLADTLSLIPAGTISPVEAGYPYDLLVVTRRGGAYTLWGADVAATIGLTRGLDASVAFSWTSADTVPDVREVGTVYFNAPRTKAAFGLTYRAPIGLTAAARGRVVAAFPVSSGVYAGRIAAYTVLDVTVGVAVPGWRAATLQLTAQNLLDRRHQEMVGAPALGRVVLGRVRATF